MVQPESSLYIFFPYQQVKQIGGLTKSRNDPPKITEKPLIFTAYGQTYMGSNALSAAYNQ